MNYSATPDRAPSFQCLGKKLIATASQYHCGRSEKSNTDQHEKRSTTEPHQDHDDAHTEEQ